MKNNYEILFEKLGCKLSDKIKEGFSYDEIREIRLSEGKPLKIVTPKGVFFKGNKNSLKCIREIFASLCDYSVHTYKEEICRGFITVCGGFRVGICGTAVYENGKIINIKDISALNIRIPHEVKNFADKLMPLDRGGILIVGPPCSGKTTLLRDFASQKSKNHFVTIVDERMEIAGVYRGEKSFDVGESTVLNGFNKCEGIEIAARTLSPDYIICDEFGDENDVVSSLHAMKSGVEIIASMHAENREDFIGKPIAKKVFENKVFKYFVFLNRQCKITEILKADDFTL